jgi:dolichyl-phosphate beta-glucosyltransferase
MNRPSVSVVIPAYNEASTIGATLEVLCDYFRATGLSCELIVVDDGSTDGTSEMLAERTQTDTSMRVIRLPTNQGKGAAVRRGVMEAKGEVIAFIDADLPYRVQNLGDAIAMVQAESTDIAIGARDLPESEHDSSYPLRRRILGRTFSVVVQMFLVPGIPDTQCGLKAFSSYAAKVLFSEARLCGFGFDFEILYLANKYGFRVERLPVSMSHRHESKVRLVRDSVHMLLDVYRVRRFNRQMAYRAPRRCPVCFSSHVWTLTQIRGQVIRQCKRCKCRYPNIFPSDQELEEFYNSDYFASRRDLDHGYASRDGSPATDRTNQRRLAMLRRILPRGARVLEVGAGTGLFGRLVAQDYDYVGLDLSEQAARYARSQGVEVYCSNLAKFVNTGGPFDVVTLFHVFEHLPDPHDALATLKELLKPGGYLVLITPDTESFLCGVSGDRWVSYKFPEHLILYSRSALIELLEHSGFEIVSASSDYEYCDRAFLLSRLQSLHKSLPRLAAPILRVLPEPLPVSSGSIALIARRRSGPQAPVRAIRAVEPTHAR